MAYGKDRGADSDSRWVQRPRLTYNEGTPEMAQIGINLNVTPEEMAVIHTALEQLVYADSFSPRAAKLADQARAILEAFPRRD